MVTRIGILKQWMKGNKNGVTLFELSRRLFEPTCRIKAKSKIVGLSREVEFLKIYLEGINIPLYFPLDVDIYWLYSIIAESLFPKDWHFYLIDDTNIDTSDIVVDCGAAEGIFTLQAQSICKKVYAIEPMRKYIDSLHKTFDNCKNVEIIPCALSSKTGKAFIQEQGAASYISSSHGDSIKLITIDDLFFYRGLPITYIKADLEGFEMEMLKGAQKTIEKNCPKLSITTYHKPEHVKEISDFLRNINQRYNIKLKGIDADKGVPVMLHAWCNV